jgi:hypothetical protein
MSLNPRNEAIEENFDSDFNQMTKRKSALTIFKSLSRRKRSMKFLNKSAAPSYKRIHFM